MTHDTHTSGPEGGPHGSSPLGEPPVPSWAPPGSGWVGSGAPTAPQPLQGHGPVQDAGSAAPADPYGHGQPGNAYGQPGYGQPGYGQVGDGGTQVAEHGGTPPQGPSRGAGTGRHRPGWPGVIGAAVVAAVLAGGTAVAVSRASDSTAPAAAVTATGSGGSGGSGSGTGSGTSGGAGGTAPAGNVNWGQVAKQVEPSVVTIQVSDGQTGGEGTGIILNTSGQVLTNNHVATAAGANGQIRIILSDGRVYQGAIKGTDPQTDLAVLQIQKAPGDLKQAVFGDSNKVAVGQPVMAVGNPLGLSDTVTTGIISATDRPVTTTADESQQGQQADPFGFGQQQAPAQPERVVTNALQTDAAINPGNSGGPLVDAAGQVIGINSSIASTSTGSGGQAGSIGLGFAIPGSEAQRVAQELVTTGKAQHALLGVSLDPNDGTATADGATRQAAIVASVTGGGAADKAGIQKGDAVTEVDGEAVTGADSLTAQVRQRAPGTQVTLTVVRGGTARQVQVVLGTK